MGTVATVLAMEFMVATEVTDLDTAIQSTATESVRLKLSPRLPPNLTTTVDTVLAAECTEATEVTDLDTAVNSGAKPHSYLRHTVLAKLHIYCSSAINDKHFR